MQLQDFRHAYECQIIHYLYHAMRTPPKARAGRLGRVLLEVAEKSKAITGAYRIAYLYLYVGR